MGLTSQYLKYEPVGVFGLVTSGRCPPACLSPRVVAAGCVENVLIWNVVTGERVALLRGQNSPVTFIAARPGTGNNDLVFRVFETTDFRDILMILAFSPRLGRSYKARYLFWPLRPDCFRRKYLKTLS